MTRTGTQRTARALRHPHRAAMQKRIDRACNAVPLSDLAQALDLQPEAVDYHAGVLASHGLVTLQRDGETLQVERSSSRP